MTDEDMMSEGNKTLRWCVGKTTCMRNSSRIIHFMPLKDFFVNDSLDFTHLFFLRALRTNGMSESAAFKDEELDRWMKGTAVRPIAETAAYLLRKKGEGLSVTEVHAGVGVTFEYLKLLLEATKGFFSLEYKGVGLAENQLKFEVLHAGERYPSRFVPEDRAAEFSGQAENRSLTIINADREIRESVGSTIRWEDSIVSGRQTLLALRVTDAEADDRRTTVKGREVWLPALSRVFQLCREHNTYWYFRLFPAFDSAFFLPEPNVGEPMLLIAYSADAPLPCDGFTELT